MEAAFENRIDDLLKEQRRSQVWLADEIGMGRTMVNIYCKNKTQPPLDMAYKIANALEVPLGDLVKVKEAAAVA